MSDGDHSEKEGPNVLITGTPGTGKSRLGAGLAKAGIGMKVIDVSKLALEKNLIEEMDSERGVPIIDDDAVLDEMEPEMARGNVVVEYHSAELFPERWFDRVIVLTTDNTILYDRLKDRGYPEKKIRENVECEIFQILAEEARNSYKEDIVAVYSSNTDDDFAENLDRVRAWVLEWREAHS